MENWEEIPNTNGTYSANENGQIKSNARNISRQSGGFCSKNKILKPMLTKRGYLTVGLHCYKTNRTKYVHRLIAETFIPNPNNLPYVLHKNDIKNDNRVENLFWGTQQDNITDMINKGRISLMSRKLNEKQISEIKILLQRRELQTKIAEKYNVSRQCITMININRTYLTFNGIVP